MASLPRAESGGRYTLYARRGEEPLVHALDTVRREALCIDLPLRLGYDSQWTLRLKLDERRRRSR